MGCRLQSVTFANVCAKRCARTLCTNLWRPRPGDGLQIARFKRAATFSKGCNCNLLKPFLNHVYSPVCKFPTKTCKRATCKPCPIAYRQQVAQFACLQVSNITRPNNGSQVVSLQVSNWSRPGNSTTPYLAAGYASFNFQNFQNFKPLTFQNFKPLTFQNFKP